MAHDMRKMDPEYRDALWGMTITQILFDLQNAGLLGHTNLAGAMKMTRGFRIKRWFILRLARAMKRLGLLSK